MVCVKSREIRDPPPLAADWPQSVGNLREFPCWSLQTSRHGCFDRQLFVYLVLHQSRCDYPAQTTAECPWKLSSSVFFLFPSPLPRSVAGVTAGPRVAPDSQVLFQGCPVSSCLSLCLPQLCWKLSSYANMGSRFIGVCTQMIYTFFFCFFYLVFLRPQVEKMTTNLKVFTLVSFLPEVAHIWPTACLHNQTEPGVPWKIYTLFWTQQCKRQEGEL